ncbi:MAG: hypothetical protein V3T08_09595 [Gemmatimonadota bacterium]
MAIVHTPGIKPPLWGIRPEQVAPEWEWVFSKQADLFTLMPFWLGGGEPRAYYRGVIPEGTTVEGNPTWAVSENGLLFTLDGTGDRLLLDRLIPAGSDLTVIHETTPADQAEGMLFYYSDGTSDPDYNGFGTGIGTSILEIHTSHISDGKVRWFVQDGTGGTGQQANVDSANAAAIGESIVIAGRKSGDDIRLYINGVDEGGDTAGGGGFAGRTPTITRFGTTGSNHAGRHYAGDVSICWVFLSALTGIQIQQLSADIYGPLRPDFRIIGRAPAAGGQTISVGLATETDTAFGISIVKTAPVGLAQEADTALAIIVAKAVTAALAQETDTGLGVSHSRALALALALETDSALALTIAKNLAVALAQETDTAFPVSSGSVIAVGLAQEADTALAVAFSRALQVGLASESDTALAAQALRTIGIGLALEMDSALAATHSRGAAVGLALETDSAFALSILKELAVGLATETDSAFAVVIIGGTQLDFVSIEDVAMTIPGVVGVQLLSPTLAVVTFTVPNVTNVSLIPD